ncbi:MAG: MraY family glycosyltransferase [Mariprofundales bacterium]|nr:MraY family glycosyltransferase [Mariprofundales bacterium]
MDEPNARKIHRQAMPRTGGLAMAAALFMTFFAFFQFETTVLAFVVGLAIVVATGLADDIWQLRPWMKFLGEVVAATCFVTLSHAAVHDFGNLLGTGPLNSGSLAIPITVFCMVGVMNALNLSDGLDGLAGGLSLIASLFLALFALMTAHWVCLAIAVALLGSLLGFLYFNSHPAKVFMGDTGSLLLGFSLSALAILLVQDGHGEARVPPISVALILALPILDTLMVMARRVYYGFSPFLPDKTHIHHRLLNLRFPQYAVVPILYSTMALFGLLALIMHARPEWQQMIAGLLLTTFIYGTVIYLQHSGWKWHARPVRWLKRAYRNRFYRQMTALAGKSVPIVSRIIPFAMALPLLFLPPLPVPFAWLGLAVCLVTAVLFPWRSSSDRLGLSHGAIYLSVFTLLSLYQMFGPPWMHSYFAWFSSILAVWVVFKLIFKRHLRVFLTSGIELLIIILSWFVPIFLGQAAHASPAQQQTISVVCLEAIPMLLAMKIIIRKQPRRNAVFAGSVIGILLLISTWNAILPT